MVGHRTGASSNYRDAGTGDNESRAKLNAGLVLLYARDFENLEPAYVFRDAVLTIGRDEGNAICVPEQAISREHACFFRQGERWFVRDLSSRNGTMVGGETISEAALEPNAQVRVGDAIFKFVDADAERFLSYRVDGEVLGEKRAKQATELIGGAQLDAIAADIERVARTELSAVVMGETGTGKEVVAKEIHRLSGRRGSFQAINCAAIPHNLLESELFGYRRGAFSGADRDKPGLVKLADGGTLFLDEIGDMPLDAQAKLLRVLQSREVLPVGGTTPERVDLRIVCATHRNLYRHVREGSFRGDLLARLNDHVVHLPALRERKEDVFLLTRTFAARFGRPNASFSFSFLLALLHYDWPFNVRELESCIKRAIAITDEETIDTAHLPLAIAEHMKTYGERPRKIVPSALPPPGSIPSVPSAPVSSGRDGPDDAGSRKAAPTEEELRALLELHKGNIAAVGRELGKERMQIHRWLKKFGIDLTHYR